MKNLRFQSCLLVSHRERSARKVDFNPRVTVLKGANDTGKSSIVKSLYQALGASPAVEHPRWKSAAVTTLLEFTVDDEQFRAFRSGGTYALFRGERLIGKYSSVSSGLGPALAELLDFRLKLPTHQGGMAVPPPAYMFLPFYCDQDKGWQATWSSFDRLGQFPKWRKEVVPYHAGMRTNKYYDALERFTNANLQQTKPRAESNALVALKAKHELGDFVDAEIDPVVFKAEIDALVTKQEALAHEREKFRLSLAQLSERRIQLTAQRDILKRVREELHADYTFSVERLSGDYVECPTCGQVHENSFGERFAIAQDESRASDLVNEIVAALDGVNSKTRSVQKRFDETSHEFDAVQEILARKHGEVTFGHIVKREGQKEFIAQLNARIGEVDELLGALEREIADAREKMRTADSAERRGQILDQYRLYMASYLQLLQVSSLAQDDYWAIDCVLKETGSDRPRAILAYMFAILGLLWESNTAQRCPLVLDSPNQQDQDADNHRLMLEFIRDKRPIDCQLILCVVDDCGIPFGGDTVVLRDKDYVLQHSEYEGVVAILAPYEAAAFS